VGWEVSGGLPPASGVGPTAVMAALLQWRPRAAANGTRVLEERSMAVSVVAVSVYSAV
jgi:hypothetical protein